MCIVISRRITSGRNQYEIEISLRTDAVTRGNDRPTRARRSSTGRRNIDNTIQSAPCEHVGGPQRLNHRGIRHQRETVDKQYADAATSISLASFVHIS